jgi:hypothetical protein
MNDLYSINDIYKNVYKLTEEDLRIVSEVSSKTAVFRTLVSSDKDVIDIAKKMNSLSKTELSELFTILSDIQVARVYQKFFVGKPPVLLHYILTGQGDIKLPIIQKYIAWKTTQAE